MLQEPVEEALRRSPVRPPDAPGLCRLRTTPQDFARWYACGQHYRYAEANWAALLPAASSPTHLTKHSFDPNYGPRSAGSGRFGSGRSVPFARANTTTTLPSPSRNHREVVPHPVAANVLVTRSQPVLGSSEEGQSCNASKGADGASPPRSVRVLAQRWGAGAKQLPLPSSPPQRRQLPHRQLPFRLQPSPTTSGSDVAEASDATDSSLFESDRSLSSISSAGSSSSRSSCGGCGSCDSCGFGRVGVAGSAGGCSPVQRGRSVFEGGLGRDAACTSGRNPCSTAGCSGSRALEPQRASGQAQLVSAAAVGESRAATATGGGEAVDSRGHSLPSPMAPVGAAPEAAESQEGQEELVFPEEGPGPPQATGSNEPAPTAASLAPPSQQAPQAPHVSTAEQQQDVEYGADGASGAGSDLGATPAPWQPPSPSLPAILEPQDFYFLAGLLGHTSPPAPPAPAPPQPQPVSVPSTTAATAAVPDVAPDAGDSQRMQGPSQPPPSAGAAAEAAPTPAPDAAASGHAGFADPMWLGGWDWAMPELTHTQQQPQPQPQSEPRQQSQSQPRPESGAGASDANAGRKGASSSGSWWGWGKALVGLRTSA